MRRTLAAPAILVLLLLAVALGLAHGQRADGGDRSPPGRVPTVLPGLRFAPTSTAPLVAPTSALPIDPPAVAPAGTPPPPLAPATAEP